MVLALTDENSEKVNSTSHVLLEDWVIRKGCEHAETSADDMHIELLRNLGWLENS